MPNPLAAAILVLILLAPPGMALLDPNPSDDLELACREARDAIDRRDQHFVISGPDEDVRPTKLLPDETQACDSGSNPYFISPGSYEDSIERLMGDDTDWFATRAFCGEELRAVVAPLHPDFDPLGALLAAEVDMTNVEGNLTPHAETSQPGGGVPREVLYSLPYSNNWVFNLTLGGSLPSFGNASYRLDLAIATPSLDAGAGHDANSTAPISVGPDCFLGEIPWSDTEDTYSLEFTRAVNYFTPIIWGGPRSPGLTFTFDGPQGQHIGPYPVGDGMAAPQFNATAGVWKVRVQHASAAGPGCDASLLLCTLYQRIDEAVDAAPAQPYPRQDLYSFWARQCNPFCLKSLD